MMWTDYSPSLESWKNRHDDIRNPFYTETKDYIKQYVTSKFANRKVKVTKDGDKYTVKYLAPNKRYNNKDFQQYQFKEPLEFAFVMVITVFFTSVLCVIPSIAGVIMFTILSLVLFATVIFGDKYTSITCGAIAISCFLVMVFVIHLVLSHRLSEYPNDYEVVKAYKAFHTIYPEYLFKFKF